MPELARASAIAAAGTADAPRADGACAPVAPDLAAFLLGLLAIGETTIDGVGDGPQVTRVAKVCAALGARVERLGDASWALAGVGVGGLVTPRAPLDLGPDMDAAALVAALVGSHPITARLVVTARAAPLAPVAAALRRMGAAIEPREENGSVGLAVTGPRETVPIAFEAAVDAAGGPSPAAAVLLAGLNSPGRVTVVAPVGALDPLVDLLRRFGARVALETRDETCAIVLEGQPELHGVHVRADAVAGASPLSPSERPGADADALATREPPAWGS
ncbi:hypothetical protein [Salinarimonas sp.]|uniref:hypothetical protein n=1 Tax=Salinarimonas sp. TaxID=2766526 RepID=UPI0032D8BF17